MNLIFFGTSDFSRPVFEALKKEGYSHILWDPSNSFEDFKKLKPDICVVAAYGKIIPKEWAQIPKFGFLNIHPSLLPKYRGASPIQSVILNGDKETGITIILMDEKIDHGPIIAQKRLKNSKFQKPNYKELEKELAELGAQLLIEILPRWIKDEIEPIKQNHAETTYTKKFSWPDGKIDWQKSAEEIDRQIRAFNPEPGIWTTWNNKILKILKGLPVSHKNDNLTPGQVFLTENRQTAIKCGFDTAILPETVQLEGKKPIDINNFLNGHRDFIGSSLGL